MVTLSDVAKAAGVSPSAVSKTLLGGGGKTTRVSEATMKRIREVAEQIGYRPNLVAQRLAGGKQNIIGFLIDSECCTLYRRILSYVERFTNEAGYRLQIGLVHDNLATIRRYVDDLLGYNIQNVICLAHYYDFGAEIPPLFKAFKNPLFINKPMGDEKFPFVSPDYYGTFAKALEYLFGLNRRKIVMIKSSYDTFDMTSRAAAFCDMHRRFGIPFEEAQIYCGNVGECDTPELTRKLLDEILPMRPDALILGSCESTLWALNQLRGRGLRVPEDVSLISMESWRGHQAVNPSITVMNNNPEGVAREAVNTIIGNMSAAVPELSEIFIEGSLEIGQSCALKQ